MIRHDKTLEDLLDDILVPSRLYRQVLELLIAKEIPDVRSALQELKDHLVHCINSAAIQSKALESGRVKKFLSSLRTSLAGPLKELVPDTEDDGEFVDCDKEQADTFYQQLLQLVDNVNQLELTQDLSVNTA